MNLNLFNRYKINRNMIDDIIFNNNLNYDFINYFKPRNFYIYKNNLFYKYKEKYLKIIPSEDIDMVIQNIFNENKEIYEILDTVLSLTKRCQMKIH